MNDLNCPNCGTTYQSIKAGFCDCCGYEFTSDYINKIVSEEKEQEKRVQQKIEEENRQRQLLLEKENREKAKTEKKAREEATKLYNKERKEREKVKALVEGNNKRYEIDLKFSIFFKKFRKAMATLGIVLVLISTAVSVVFSDELSVSFIAPQNVISNKFETIYQELTLSVVLDEEKNILKKKKETEDTIRLSKGTVKLFNSISSIVQNQRTVKEKLSYMFPKSTALINEFIESSKEIDTTSKIFEETSEKVNR